MTNTQAVTPAPPVVIHLGVTGHRLSGLARAHEALLRVRIREGLEYEQDFHTPASRATYQALLARATAVLELHGCRETTERAQEAYEAVGRLVLQESDILMAVWNGDAPRGRGGTGQIVAEARQQHLPVIWIQAHTPREVRVLGSRDVDRGRVLAVDELVRHLASCVS